MDSGHLFQHHAVTSGVARWGMLSTVVLALTGAGHHLSWGGGKCGWYFV